MPCGSYTQRSRADCGSERSWLLCGRVWPGVVIDGHVWSVLCSREPSKTDHSPAREDRPMALLGYSAHVGSSRRIAHEVWRHKNTAACPWFSDRIPDKRHSSEANTQWICLSSLFLDSPSYRMSFLIWDVLLLCPDASPQLVGNRNRNRSPANTPNVLQLSGTISPLCSS